MNNRATICVCGAGTMGSGIAQVFAQHGFNTILFDVNGHMLETAKGRIAKFDKDGNNLGNIKFTSDIAECKGEFIIEAIVEKVEAKVELLNRLSELNAPGTVYATNTSSLSVSELSRQIPEPANFAGMHFFNPAPRMKLVEIVKGEQTSASTVDFIANLARITGKTPVICKDSPGFIVNRVARPYYLEALYLAEKNINIEMIDSLMESSGFKMGPFKLMDLIGNDINYSVSCIVHEALGKPARLKPSTLQQQKVQEGLLGKKTGRGYYEYPDSQY